MSTLDSEVTLTSIWVEWQASRTSLPEYDNREIFLHSLLSQIDISSRHVEEALAANDVEGARTENDLSHLTVTLLDCLDDWSDVTARAPTGTSSLALVNRTRE